MTEGEPQFSDEDIGGTDEVIRSGNAFRTEGERLPEEVFNRPKPLSEEELLMAMERPEGYEHRSQFDIKDPELPENVEQIADRYHFNESKSQYEYSDSLPGANKMFLALLDEKLSKAGYNLPDKKTLNCVDFGAGLMPYLRAYEIFFERYGMPEGQKREVVITGWDNGVDRQPGGKISWIGSELRSQEDVNPHFHDGLDVVTMFACGPSSEVTDPKLIETTYEIAISAFAQTLVDGGLLFITTSFGGPKNVNLVKALKENGLEVILNEPNPFNNEEFTRAIGNIHNDVIIAKKRENESQ